MDNSTRISVAVRVRPLLPEEYAQGETCTRLRVDTPEKSVL
jgi:hypothetical protein